MYGYIFGGSSSVGFTYVSLFNGVQLLQMGFCFPRSTLFPLTAGGWMICEFTSFLTVYPSYPDDVWMILKGCVQWNSVYG